MSALRTSNYLVLVPIPDDPMRFLAHHGIRGGCELVTRDDAELMVALAVGGSTPLHGEWVSEPTHLPAREASSLAEGRIDALKARGYLTTWTAAEEEALFMHAVRTVHQRSLAAAMGYDFLVSYEQPMGEATGHVGLQIGGSAPRGVLQRELIDQICGSLPAFETELDVRLGEESPRRIGIVGASSLRAANRGVVEYLIDRVSALGAARIWAESTGQELDEFAESIGPNGISKISLLVRHAFDPRTARAASDESVRAFGRAVELVLRRGSDVLVKLHVTSQNAAALPDIGNLIAAHGWADEPRLQLQLITDQQDPDEFGRDSSVDDRVLHPALRRLTMAKPIRIPATRSILSEQLDVVSKLVSDHRYHSYVFDPHGHLYLSIKEAGDPRLRIGEFDESDGKPRIRFVGSAAFAPIPPRSAVSKAAASCRRCPYGIHCGWSQEVQWLLMTTQRGGNVCDAFAAYFRNAIAELWQVSNPSAARSLEGM